MRTHDDDFTMPPPGTAPAARGPDGAPTIAQRALASARPDVLDTAAVAHLQRAAGNAGVGGLLGAESPILSVVGSGGRPLEPGTRNEMEAAFGQDFSGVRVHTDAKASDSAKAVQAQAYTVGNDVVFQEGKYAPESPTGKRTLAHELAHVVQQRSGPVEGTPAEGGISVSDPSDRFEQAAEHAADRVVSGHGAHVDGAGAPPPVQRAPDGDDASRAGFVQREAARTEDEKRDEDELPT